MLNLTTSTINDEEIQTVNARELHSFLGLGKDFSTWIKVQIARARLIQNKDYTSSPSKGISGQTLTEYHLTLESGKQIAMMSETDKGFQVRDYFLECERKSKDPLAHIPPEHRALVALLCENAAIKAKQAEHEARLAIQQASIQRIEAKQCAFEKGHSYFTVLAFCAIRDVKLGMADMQKLGKLATKASKSSDTPIDKVRDMRYGYVNSYHEDSLDAAFCELHGGL